MSNRIDLKKKIAIITLYGDNNFGNRLQNFACHKILSDRGFKVDTLVVKELSIKGIARMLKSNIQLLFNKRRKKISRFNNKYISSRVVWRSKKLFNEYDAYSYDYFVVGSDQVWNPMIRLNERDNFFLRFAKRNQRICISPSIAVGEIPSKDVYDYSYGLSGFPYLSCREDSGKALVEKIAQKNCEHLLDPTLVIPAETWRLYSNNKKPKSEGSIVLFFLSNVPKEAYRIAELLSDRLNTTIQIINDYKSDKYGIDPFEFINIIDNAKVILTDSFHGVAFSINMNTPFYVFNRQSNDEKENQINSRILSLLKVFDLTDRLISEYNNKISYELELNYNNINKIMNSERIKFDNYIEKCLKQQDYLSLRLPEETCNGCGICTLKCPVKCISMDERADGFKYPNVELSKCINCGKCIDSCPVMDKNGIKSEKEVFSAYNIDNDEVALSSSGAIFPTLAKRILKDKGAVIGAYLDSDLVLKHIIITQERDLWKLRYSKYIQSDIRDTLPVTLDLLESNIKVLYTGTPCQIAALKHYIKKDYSNLFTLDCACHGVPSPGFWRKWVNQFEKDNKCLIHSVLFRDKRNTSWDKYKITYFTDHGELAFERTDDAFLQAFQKNLSLRQSCFKCKFKGWNRYSDMTLADFWGIDRINSAGKNQNGTSMVLVHTEKGRKLFNDIMDYIILTQIDYKKAEKVNMATWKSVDCNENYNSFNRQVISIPIKMAVDMFTSTRQKSMISRIIKKLGRL